MQNIYILHNQTELQGHNGALNGCKVLNNVSLVMVYVDDSQTTDWLTDWSNRVAVRWYDSPIPLQIVLLLAFSPVFTTLKHTPFFMRWTLNYLSVVIWKGTMNVLCNYSLQES